MNNYCRNCGIKLENNVKECPNCKTEVFETRITEKPKTKITPEQAAKERKYILTIISLFILSILTPEIGKTFYSLKFLSILSWPLLLSSIILLIYARITTKNKTIEALFVILIASLIYIIVGTIFMMITCTTIIPNCVG